MLQLATLRIRMLFRHHNISLSVSLLSSQHGRHPVREPPETEAGPAEAAGQRAAEAEAAAAGQESTYLFNGYTDGLHRIILLEKYFFVYCLRNVK